MLTRCSPSNQNESDVLKWVVRKEFGELRRCLEVEEAGFMQQVETSTAVLISSLQSQTDQLNLNLTRLQEAHNTLQDLSNEGHLGFITVRSARCVCGRSVCVRTPVFRCGTVSILRSWMGPVCRPTDPDAPTLCYCSTTWNDKPCESCSYL